MTDARISDAVTSGLATSPKSLPSWLLYDAAGCALYERITRLPEYYLTRAEAEIFAEQGDAIVAAAHDDDAHLSLAELGAGTATKTELLLRAMVRAQGSCVYLACDQAPGAIAEATQRLRVALPEVTYRPVVGTHGEACEAIRALEGRQLALFIGSSIGNYPDPDAITLLCELRAALRDDAYLLLGTDLVKAPQVLVAAYDDAEGVTARFSKNLLVRLNRELGANFDVAAFEHVALWEPRTSNVEIYLESIAAQRVRVCAREFSFDAGERIHIETSAKYDPARVDQILAASGFERRQTFTDAAGRFAVHLARASDGRC